MDVGSASSLLGKSNLVCPQLFVSIFFVVILCISRVGISRFMFEGNSFVSGTSERSIFDKVQVDEDINKGIEAYKSISNNSRD